QLRTIVASDRDLRRSDHDGVGFLAPTFGTTLRWLALGETDVVVQQCQLFLLRRLTVEYLLQQPTLVSALHHSLNRILRRRFLAGRRLLSPWCSRLLSLRRRSLLPLSRKRSGHAHNATNQTESKPSHRRSPR